MARTAGRFGAVYIATTNGGSAEPANFIESFSVDFGTDDIEVTALGDSFKSYVQGLPDASISGSGFFDAQAGTGTAGVVAAGLDGLSRKAYFYLTSSRTTDYVYGTFTFKFTAKTSVKEAVSFDFEAKPAASVGFKTA